MTARSSVAALAVAAVCAADSAAAQSFEPTAFTQLAGVSGCMMQIGYDVDHGCTRVGGLALARSVTLSPDERFVYVASGGTFSVGANGIAVFRRDTASGALTRAGCVTASAGDGRLASEGACARGDALLGAADVAISADGRHAYVAAAGAGGIAWLDRDAESGALRPGGCLKDTPRGDRCGRAPLLGGAVSVVVSPDGAHVYVAATDNSAVHALRRDAVTGALTPAQCVTETGADGACDAAAGLQDVDDLAIAPDGRWVFATGGSGAVAIFARDAHTGLLAVTGCLFTEAPDVGPCRDAGGIAGAAGIAVSPDSRDVSVAAPSGESLASFRVQPDGRLLETGCLQRVPANREDGMTPDKRCRPATALWAPREIVVSADGRTVFAGGYDTITSYRRDPETGTLTQSGCAEEERSSKACLQVRATLGVNALAATADGRNIYVTAEAENAVTVLGAAVTVRSSVLRVGRSGQVAIAVECPAVRARPCAGDIAAGSAAKRAFRLDPGARTRVRVPITAHARRVLARRGIVRLAVRAGDREGSQRPTRHRVVLRAAGDLTRRLQPAGKQR
jgi:DNA-binding beta-propeller fold protein YncE